MTCICDDTVVMLATIGRFANLADDDAIAAQSHDAADHVFGIRQRCGVTRPAFGGSLSAGGGQARRLCDGLVE